MTHDTNPMPDAACTVSIIIKALNEESNISAAIKSALQAAELVGGEVILADSCSTDQTVALAAQFPIRIVQLSHPGERCCGIGPQLGYQHSLGEFIYILDGDMQLIASFLPEALAFMRMHPDMASVGGRVIETNTESLEYVARMDRASKHMQSGLVDRLDGGGLYRRTAIEEVGYLSNRNLHSYEEFDLATRLRSRGWKLWRIPIDSVTHHGHDTPPYQLLMRRWKNNYLCGIGELIRAAWGAPHIAIALSGLRELRIYTAVLVWWMLLLGIPFTPLPWITATLACSILLVIPFFLMTVRKRSLSKAIFSVVSWCFCTAGLLRGLRRQQRSATGLISSKIILDAVEISHHELNTAQKNNIYAKSTAHH